MKFFEQIKNGGFEVINAYGEAVDWLATTTTGAWTHTLLGSEPIGSGQFSFIVGVAAALPYLLENGVAHDYRFMTHYIDTAISGVVGSNWTDQVFYAVNDGNQFSVLADNRVENNEIYLYNAKTTLTSAANLNILPSDVCKTGSSIEVLGYRPTSGTKQKIRIDTPFASTPIEVGDLVYNMSQNQSATAKVIELVENANGKVKIKLIGLSGQDLVDYVAPGDKLVITSPLHSPLNITVKPTSIMTPANKYEVISTTAITSIDQYLNKYVVSEPFGYDTAAVLSSAPGWIKLNYSSSAHTKTGTFRDIIRFKITDTFDFGEVRQVLTQTSYVGSAAERAKWALKLTFDYANWSSKTEIDEVYLFLQLGTTKKIIVCQPNKADSYSISIPISYIWDATNQTLKLGLAPYTGAGKSNTLGDRIMIDNVKLTEELI